MIAAMPVARLKGISLAYGAALALRDVTLDISAGCMVGLIGPDGVGKSSLLSLIAGAHVIQDGDIEVLGGDMRRAAHRHFVCPRIAYMPQGLGKNLYPTLSVFENVDFFGRLFGLNRTEREERIHALLRGTGLAPFADRPAGKLSGGMKQKLGLCCALIHDPDLLILDEPTTGVDPLSRRQFWDLIGAIRDQRAGMSVLVATAYMEEAATFDWLVAMNAGQILATGTPAELRAQTDSRDLDAAFIALLPEELRREHRAVEIPPRPASDGTPAIEAEHLTIRFGDFTAVDDVSFRIDRGEIFGFLGSNGCGKTTTMKMLTGLLPPSQGRARLFGEEIDPNDMRVRRQVGYMSQSFSLYTELTVRQNLDLHARLFGLAAARIPDRIAESARQFGLEQVMETLPDALPLGMRQRLSLAVAMIHEPALLILDEPTSGVDPVARDSLWQSLIELARRDNVTIFISTHFMNEAERCDRISLMHAGRVLVTGTPADIIAQRGAATLEEAFIQHLEAAAGEMPAKPILPAAQVIAAAVPKRFDLRRMLSYTRREALELRRDVLRTTLALLGSVILMFVIGYGINLDVNHLAFAVMDEDQTALSQNYVLNLAGSRYFDEHVLATSQADLERRIRNGELSMGIEIPPGFAADVARGRAVRIGVWIDGTMPQRAETIRGYVEAMHAHWLANLAAKRAGGLAAPYQIQIRYRYNPGVESLVAMVPAMIPLLLLMIPAILAALSVVREKELGSIINLYVTPVSRLEFLLGKQLPYIALSMISFLLLTAQAVWVLGVPFTGSFMAFALGALLYVTVATGFGLLVSSFMNSQVAAIFGTAILTMVPAVQFCGIINPLSSMQGLGVWIGRLYPTTYFITIARGTFSKGLGLLDIQPEFIALSLTIPVLLGAAILRLKKQAA